MCKIILHCLFNKYKVKIHRVFLCNKGEIFQFPSLDLGLGVIKAANFSIHAILF